MYATTDTNVGDVVTIAGENTGKYWDVIHVEGATAHVQPIDPYDPTPAFDVAIADTHRVLDGLLWEQIMIEGARVVDGKPLRWANHMTTACSTTATGAGRLTTRHDQCNGWAVPLVMNRPCICPCHDEARMPLASARLLVLDRVAADSYNRAVNAAGGRLGADQVVEAEDAWLDARINVVRDGLDPAAHRLQAMPEDLEGALGEVMANYERAAVLG